MLAEDLAGVAPTGRGHALRSLGALATAVAVAAALVVTAGPAAAAPGKASTIQVSVPSGGFDPGSGNNGGSRHTERRLVSDDGRYVVFESSGQLVPGQKALEWQIVKRDRKLGTTTLISKSSKGKRGNGRSSNPSMSANGRYIAFTSEATNLVPGDTNKASDVFLHDSKTGKTTRISVSSSGKQVRDTRGYGSGPASISANGKFVSFLSYAPGLAAGDTDGSQAYLHDVTAGTTELVSLGADNLPRSAMTDTSVSRDGNLVLFSSLDANVTPPESHNLDVNIFLRDRAAGTTRMVAGAEDGAQYGTLSADGRYMAFQTSESLVDADTNRAKDIYLLDLTRSAASPVLVSRTSSGAVGDKESLRPSISADGRYIVYESSATNLLSGKQKVSGGIFRFDTKTATTVLVSVRNSGKPSTSSSYSAAISGNGQHILFDSYDREMTKVSTRTWRQVFVRDLADRWPALYAKSNKLPKRITTNAKARVTVRDLAKGERLQIVWAPAKGKKIRQTVTVKGNAFTVKSPAKRGSYMVTVSYGDHLLRSGSITVLKKR